MLDRSLPSVPSSVAPDSSAALRPNPNAQLSAFLSRFSPKVVALTRRGLLTLRRIFPGAIQLVYDSRCSSWPPGSRLSIAARLVRPGGGRAGLVECAAAPHLMREQQVATEAGMMGDTLVVPGTPLRGLRPLATLLLVAIGGWITVSAFQPLAGKACIARYQAAKTLADTAQVDAFVPRVPGNRGPEAHSCGFTRHAARW